MRLAVLIMTDGRYDLLAECVDSLAMKWDNGVSLFMHDDSGDDTDRRALAVRFPLFTQIGSGPRRGFGGAYRHAWQHLSGVECDYVFATEDDFLFTEPVDINRMAEVLTARPYLVQMALRRQAWGPVEEAAGGVVELHPEAYTDVTDGEREWLEHRLFFTTNPSLYRRSLVGTGWPTGARSEGRLTARLLLDGTPEASGADIRFGYWGARSDPPRVHHIGVERVGRGY